MLALLKRYWPALVALALIVGAFLAGRHSAPTKTVEVVRESEAKVEVVREETKQEERTQVEVKTDEREVKVQVVTRWRTRIVKPDGTVIEKDGEKHDNRDEKGRTDEKRDVVEHVASAGSEVATAQTREAERIKVVERPRADWRATALVGLAPARLLPPDFAHAPLIVGGLVERRIAGPLSAGLAVQVPLGGGSPILSGGLTLEF